jgi:predicted DNA-binding transcriptional regulator YafY
MKIDRLLSITLLLINRPIITAKELSERFDVSIRTIYRDIESIAAAGIPVTACNGKGGGYCLMENYRVDRQLLSLDDMLSILTALKGINTSLNNSDIDNTIEKIESLVPDDKVPLVRQHFENIIIDLSPWYNETGNKLLLEQLNRAIAQNHLISFNYRNLKGEESLRKVEPMTLILKTWCWYCFGFCTDKNDYRLFRLSRINQFSMLDQTFKRREMRFVDTELLKEDSRTAVSLQLRFSPDALSIIEEHFGSHPRTIDNEGYFVITVEYPEDEWVYSSILGYGDKCEVLSPAHVRSIIGARLNKAAKLYTT